VDISLHLGKSVSEGREKKRKKKTKNAAVQHTDMFVSVVNPAVPENVPLPATYHNPAIPSSLLPPPAPPAPAIAYQQRSPSLPRTIMLGTGPERKYLPLKTLSPPWDGVDGRSEIGEEDRIPSGYPPRPVPGSIADLDMIYEKCSFTKGKVSVSLDHQIIHMWGESCG
jgi:hypothetical protein